MEQVVTIGEGALRWLYIDTVKCPTKLHSYWVLIFLDLQPYESKQTH
jgi:hypothetical protein